MAMMSMPWLLSILALALTIATVALGGAEKLWSVGGSPFVQNQNRALQICNEVLGTWTKDQVSEIVESALSAQFGSNSTETPVASFTLLPAITYGVEVRRLCASCSDFPVVEQPVAYTDFCTGYGSNTSFSGLLMIPLDVDGSILPGTHAGNIFCHGTSTKSVPSTEFQGGNLGSDLILNLAITSTGAVTLMPDYMGYGESSGTIFKAYLVKRQYKTSIIPLWLMADRIIQTESNCTAALASATAIVGYSEGGYAAVALAEGLDKMGVDIIKVEAGAGPYRMASAVIVKTTENTDLGLFPSNFRHLFALLGAAYSSTYPELPNFDLGQNMLNSVSRSKIVELITSSASEQEVQSSIPIDYPLSVFNSELVSFVREAIEDGDYDPCNNTDRVIEGITDKLCDALQENDLTLVLETSPYPVRLCHSPDDEVVSFDNLPNFDQNVLLEFLASEGTHVASAVPCLLAAVLFMLSDDFQNYTVKSKDTDEGCPAFPTLSFAPSLSLSPSPVVAPGEDTSVPSGWVAPSVAPTSEAEHRYKCGTILSSLSASEAKALITEAFSDMFGKESQAFALFQLSVDTLEFGVQVRTLCASCDGFDVTADSYDEYCGQGVYGYSTIHSGLLMLPMSSDGTMIAEGTFPGAIYNHDPNVDRVPSRGWDRADSSRSSEIMFGVLPAAAGSVAILPDYFGYGESNNDIFKAFLVKQSYQTSIVPLWLKAAAIIDEESDCSALADAATVAGTSEGGYASVVVADALHYLGIEIIRVQAGAVPARLGSIIIPELVKGIDTETFPVSERFLVALLGSAYSSTYADVLNFEEGPYLLNSSVREEIVGLVTESANRTLVNEVVPSGDVLSILDEEIVSWAREAYEQNVTDPCSMDLTEGLSNLCATLAANDLTDLLESVPYSIYLCHSPDDDVVSVANLPDEPENTNLNISLVNGDHFESSAICKTQIILFLSSPAYLAYPIVDKHAEGACDVPMMETEGPETEGATSSPSNGFRATGSLLLSVLCALSLAVAVF